MNEAYKLLVLVPNSAPHKCLKNKQKLALILFFMFFSSAVGTCYAEVWPREVLQPSRANYSYMACEEVLYQYVHGLSPGSICFPTMA